MTLENGSSQYSDSHDSDTSQTLWMPTSLLHARTVRLAIWTPLVLASLLQGVLFAQSTQQIPDYMYPIINDAGRLDIATLNENKQQIDNLRQDGWGTPVIVDFPSGLRVGVWDKILPDGKKERILAFSGTKGPRDFVTADLLQGAAGPELTPQYRDALDFVRKQMAEKDKSPHLSLTLTGHSLGGGIAQLLNLELGVQTVVFNAAPLNVFGPLGKDRVDQAHVASNDLWNLRARGDVVSALPQSQFGRVLSFDLVRPTTGQWEGSYSTHSVEALLDAINTRWASPVKRNWWTVERPGQTVSAISDAQIMSSMAASSDAKRIIVAGAGAAAREMYDLASSRVGSGNVRWLQSNPSSTELQVQAHTFGADTILGVRNPRPDPPRDQNTSLRPPKLSVPLPPPCPPGSPACGGGGGGAAIDRGDRENGGGGGAAFHPATGGVGGVMLSGTAKVTGSDGTPAPLGAGQFSLLFENPADGIDFAQYRKFVTALWAVYFDKEGPGISIDPIAEGADQQFVRYIGDVERSDLGRVMREADYRMKKWAVGSEHPDIPGFQSVDRLTKENGLRYLGAARRFWFVPENMQFRQAGNTLLFDSGSMTVKTEYILQNKGEPAEPADEAFAKAFTDRYAEIAARYPVYQELFEYAKLVSLARYVKQNGVPLFWFLLANKDLVLTEKAPPETVKSLIKKSEVLQYVTIEGGVDLARHAAQERYIRDDRVLVAYSDSRYSGNVASEHATSIAAGSPAVVSSVDRDYALQPSSQLVVSGGAQGGSRYQTDLALRRDGEPGLELVREFNPSMSSSQFGPGWRVMEPYRVEPASETKVPFANLLVPEKMRVENLITGRTEVLTFNRSRYSAESYVPDNADLSALICLVWMSDGNVRLLDKLGNEFQFDGLGRTTEFIVSRNYKVDYVYDTEHVSRKVFDKLPYELKVDGTDRQKIAGGSLSVPSRFVLRDLGDGSEEVFTLDQRPSHREVGWTPQSGAGSKYKFMALMTDGSFSVEDRESNEIEFDAGGDFDRVSVPVLRALRQGDQRIEFEYEYHAGQFRAHQARVMREGLSASLYEVDYDYGSDGRLASVKGPDGTVSEIHYEGSGAFTIAGK